MEIAKIGTANAATDKTPVQLFIENVQEKTSNQAEQKQKNTRLNVQTSDELIFSAPEVQHNSDLKLAQILNKYNLGKELTMEELHYLEEHSPDTAKKVRQMMAERKQIESLMKKAKTKSQAMLSAALVMNNVNKSTNNPTEANLRLKHLRDVVNEYEKSAEFRAKADIELELAKNPSDKLRKKAEKAEKAQTAENTNANQTAQTANTQQDTQDVKNTQNLLGQSENVENTAKTEKKSGAQSYDKTVERSEIEKEEKADRQKDEKIKRYKSQHSKTNVDFKI